MLTYFSLSCCHFLYLRFLFRFITSSTIFWVFARFSECLLSSSSCSPMVLVRCSITNRWAAWKVTKQTFHIYLGSIFCAINQRILTKYSHIINSFTFLCLLVTICNWAQQANKRHTKILFFQDLKLLWSFFYLNTRYLSLA